MDPSDAAVHPGIDAAAPPAAPGEDISWQQQLLNTATSTLQNFQPIKKLCQHVCAFHCYAHDTTRQVGISIAGYHNIYVIRQMPCCNMIYEYSLSLQIVISI